jgi:hypothetical protein
MDINTMYAASQLGKQDEYDTQIVKDVWNNDFYSFTEKDFAGETNMCEAVYESQGSAAFNMCRSAALSCGEDSNCNTLATKYSQALVGGYSKDFASFKKKTSNLGAIGDIASGLLGGWISNLGGGGKEGDIQLGGSDYYEPQKKNKLGTYILVGVVAVIGIGAAIYFLNKKK